MLLRYFWSNLGPTLAVQTITPVTLKNLLFSLAPTVSSQVARRADLCVYDNQGELYTKGLWDEDDPPPRVNHRPRPPSKPG